MTTFSNREDMLDVRDIIARVEELEALAPETAHDVMPGTSEAMEENARELEELTALLTDMAGRGGDEEWRGAWYPVTLIHEDYFEQAMDDLLEEIGALQPFEDRPCYIQITVDYDALKMDYTSVDYTTEEQGTATYWYR